MPEPIYENELDSLSEYVMEFVGQQLDYNDSINMLHKALVAMVNKQNTIISELEKRVYLLENEQDISRNVQ